MTSWNLADVWQKVADALPEANSLISSNQILTWKEVNERSSRLAQYLSIKARERQEKVAQYMYNCPQYMESLFAIFKAALVPINTNYRYGDDEILYLWDNADVTTVIFAGSFLERVERLREKLPRIQTWIFVDDITSPCPTWAVKYDDIVLKNVAEFIPKFERSGDDLYILYTGGTTGMPKGVMWRQDDVFSLLNTSNFVKYDENAGLDQIKTILTAPGPVHLAACPLMHGTGALTSFAAWTIGGSIVTLANKSFDPKELLDTVEKYKVSSMAIVGDAFAKPILKTLDENPGKWDLSSLFVIISSGVIWSEPVKDGLLKHNPNMLLVDTFGSSEALGLGTSVSTATSKASTAKFLLGHNALVIDENNCPVGPGQIGKIAVRGRTPIGYYKDEEKSKATFPVIDNVRYSVPGDFARVEEDGSITLLGRGSVCINTGGEKVYPEEVEEALKLHPAVFDAAAVGVPDDRFGEVVAAVIELDSTKKYDETEIISFVKTKLAAYKAPKYIQVVNSLNRSPSGKLDYAALKQSAISHFGL
jgi:acyl-CoA synthetase (AMP-forming)/AMP-acid ligase II